MLLLLLFCCCLLLLLLLLFSFYISQIHFQLYIRSENPTNHIYINAGMTPGTYRLMYNVLAAGDDRRVMISSQNMSIICSPNYYGPSCTSFCVPANDSTRGYYNCDASTGDKICHEGYHRPEELCRHRKKKYFEKKKNTKIWS